MYIGAYLNEGEGKNDTLHCRKCKIFADKCGIFVLVLYDVFSKNFIARVRNLENDLSVRIRILTHLFTTWVRLANQR